MLAVACGLAACASGGDGEPSETDGSATPSESAPPGDTAEPSETASPEPSTPDAIEPLDDAVVGAQPMGVGAAWIEPGETLAVFLTGSGTADCVAAPVSATASDATTIEIERDDIDPMQACTMDLVQYGWSVPIADEVDATQEVTVRIGQDEPEEVVVGPDDVIEP